MPLSWTAVANTGTYRVECREGDFGYWTVDGLLCGTQCHFRVSAYSSGPTYSAAWSDPSAGQTAQVAGPRRRALGGASASARLEACGRWWYCRHL